MVRPLLRLVDVAEHELEQFEACMALTNLASASESLQERLLAAGAWRRLLLLLSEDNPEVCRAALECLANLSTADESVELFTSHESTDLKIFLGMCESDDVPSQRAASGALATLASVPEVAAAMLHQEIRGNTLDKVSGLLLSLDQPELQHRAAVWLRALAAHDHSAIFAPEAPRALAIVAALSLCARGNIGPAPEMAKELLRDAEAQAGRALPAPPPEMLKELLEKCRAEEAERRRAAEERALAEEEERVKKVNTEREKREGEMRERAAQVRLKKAAEDLQSRKWAGEIDSDDEELLAAAEQMNMKQL